MHLLVREELGSELASLESQQELALTLLEPSRSLQQLRCTLPRFLDPNRKRTASERQDLRAPARGANASDHLEGVIGG